MTYTGFKCLKMMRTAVISDAQQIAQVHIQSWRETYQNIIDQHMLDQLNLEEKTKTWQAVLVDPKQIVCVYEEHNKILGFACYFFSQDMISGELRALYLLNQIQGRGGAKWLKQVECCLKIKIISV